LQITRWFVKISLVHTTEMREIFSDAAGEREMALKCGSLLRDAGDLAGLSQYIDGSPVSVEDVGKKREC